jgi:hypothetical protein
MTTFSELKNEGSKEPRPAGVAAGIFDGLGSFIRLWSGSKMTRRYRSGGVTSDWRAVGRDLQTALSTWKVDETP